MKFEELKRSLSQGIDSFYIINGKDGYLRQKAQEMIENKAVPTLKDINITRYNDDNYNLDAILSDLDAMPMMADNRVVVLKDITMRSTSDSAFILKKLESKQKTNSILIINDGLGQNWFKNLTKYATIVDCSPLDEVMLRKIALKSFQDNQVNISIDALQALIQYCSADLLKINNEVNKLSNYVGQGGMVNKKVIDEIVHKDLEYNIFELSNAVSKQDANTALQIVKYLLTQKESPQVLLMMLLSNFRRMFFAVISKESTAEIANKLGVKEYAIKVAKDIGKRFTPIKLKKILDFGGELDYKIKAGEMNAENALYYFITNITL